MKHLLLLSFLAAVLPLFGQTPFHFLITTDQQVTITEPMCESMIKETTAQFEQYLKDGLKGIKKEKEVLTTEQSCHLESAKAFAQNIKVLAPAFYIKNLLGASYSQFQNPRPYFSLQKVQLQELGAVSIEIHLSKIQISPSETSMDITVSNPTSNQFSKSAHFSLPTGILLNLVAENPQMQYYIFWRGFDRQTKLYEWLFENITAVNPAILSPEKSLALLNEPIKNSKFLSSTYLEQARKDAWRILKEVPYQIPFDQIQAILISQDESKIWFKTFSTELFEWNQESYNTEKEWVFLKKDKNWLFTKVEADINSIENKEDTIDWKISFYRNAFDLQQTPWTYKEEEWTQIVEATIGNYDAIQFNHVISSEDAHQLIEQYIKPQLNKLLQQDTYAYSSFYQRQSPAYGEYTGDDNNYYTTVDFLITNPEKTAFLYPVLLHHKKEQERYYYYTNEDFKFYVLLKNNDGTYQLYDWHYFKTIPYKNYYNLTNCVESHLTNITTYNAGQEIIEDANFWNNYVFKTSERGYDNLIPVVAQDESIRIGNAQFEAQVADCIKLIQENDISTLYPNQLKQIIRCVNTIDKWNLKGSSAQKLVSLSNELKLQNRINKVQENTNGYYPQLDLEFKMNVQPHAYYILE